MSAFPPLAGHAGWHAHLLTLRQEFAQAVARKPTLKHLIFQSLNLPVQPLGSQAGKYRPMPDSLHLTLLQTASRMEAWVLAPGDRYRLPSITPELASSPLLQPTRSLPGCTGPSCSLGEPIATPDGLVDLSQLSARGCYGIGFLYGPTPEADAFTKLSERAWLALPPHLAGDRGDERRGPYPLFQQLPVYSERPCPHFGGVSLCRTESLLIEQHEHSMRWLGLLYRTLRRHMPHFLDQDGGLCVLRRNEVGEENVTRYREDEAAPDPLPPDLVHFRVTALATDPFTASLAVFDALLNAPGAHEDAVRLNHAAMTDNWPRAEEALGQYVTLNQMAAAVSRAKRTLEKRKGRKRNPLPPPAIEGGGGKPDEWLWDTVRPWLEKEFGRKLPEQFPGDRFKDGRADRS